MIRKNLITALMCTFCLAVSAVSPVTVLAEETETVTETGSEAEEAAEVTDRPSYTASDYVELGEYKGLQVTKGSAEVTDDEILEEVTHDVSLADKLETLTEGTVQKWDTANIDFEGKLNGEAFDGGTSKGYDLEIGSGSFIAGFEDGLIGVQVGETVDLPLTFPENYGNADLAGQDVIFTVTVNEIKRAPELTDELVSTITDSEYSDVESYRESLRAELQADKESVLESQVKADLVSLVAGGSTITGYPQEVIDYLVDNNRTYYENYAAAYSMEFEDFLLQFMGMTEEQFEEETLAQAQEFMEQELYLTAIAEAEGIEISDEEYSQECQQYADQYGYDSVEDFVAQNGEGNIRSSMIQNKVLDFLLENAVITQVSETETDGEAESGQDTETETDTETDTETESGADSEAETETPEETEGADSSAES